MSPSTALARVLVDELVRLGVQEAVLCPGSRSAPLAYALQDADRDGRLRLHVRIDERTAAFLALGLAKLSRRAVPVVTTSGTAVANLHPAVLEAAHAAVPLLVVSADRPAELLDTGANQTTRQEHLFGSAVRWYHALHAGGGQGYQPGGPAPALAAEWRAVADRAWAAALGTFGGDAGPVHLNVALREPLVPDVRSSQDADAARPAGRSSQDDAYAGRPDGRAWLALPERPQGVYPSADPIETCRRTLAVLGDLPTADMAAQALDLARRAGWPVVAEPFGHGSRASVMPHGSLVLMATEWLATQRPSRVIVLGRPTLSRAVPALLRDPQVRVEVVSATAQWPDPGHVAAQVHPWGAVGATLERLEAAEGRSENGLDEAADDDGWTLAWHRAGADLAAFGASLIDGSWPSTLAVAQTMLSHLPSGATLFVGSSNVARAVDLAARAGDDDTTVVANRGLAGIDGCLSTAIGIALSRPGQPAYALLGDLTFLHDTNAMVIGPHEPRPDLTVVVVNDDGGGIFTLLEPGEPDRSDDFERLFGTPTGVRLADLCRANDVAHQRVSTADELAAAVGRRPRGLSVLEVAVARSSHRGLQARLTAAAVEALG